MEELARGSRERRQLRACAGPGDEHTAERLGMVGPDLQPGFYGNTTAFMASLDVKTAVDVAKPSVVSRILTLTGVHGHLTAALLAEMQDDREFARLENSETEFQVFSVHPPRWRGSSGAVGTCGQIRAVESRRKVESNGLETTLWRTARQ